MKSFRKTHPSLYKNVIGVAVAISVSLFIFLFYFPDFLKTFENKTGDIRFRLFSDENNRDPDIVIIAVDEESLNFYRDNLGTWPWPREVFGAVVDFLKTGGADTVVFDIIFPEPDIKNRASDEALSESVRKSGNVVTSLVFRPGRSGIAEDYESMVQRLYLKENRSLELDNKSGIEFTDYTSVTLPYLALLTMSSGVGATNFVADPDGPSRGTYPIFKYGGDYYPSLALLSAMKVMGVDPFKTDIEIGKDRVLNADRIGIPLLKDGRMMINWHGPYMTYKYYQIGDILESILAIRDGKKPAVLPTEFSGKVVLIGVTAISLYDLRATPFSPVYPGVELNATVIDNIVNGSYVRHVPKETTALLIFLLAFLTASISLRVGSATRGIISFFVIFSAFTAIAACLFYAQRVMLDYLAPSGAILLSFVVSLVVNYVTEGRAKRRFKDAFSKYVSHQVADEISKNIDDLKVDVGERKEISVLFSDIRGFTSMSEDLPPEEVVRRLNRYLGAMVEVVFRFGGTLDKYIGDAIMAFFGAPKDDPDHAMSACRCALAMVRELDKVNKKFTEEGLPKMQIGVGVNTGEVVVGNIGSELRIDYTVIGDHVNLASRLEGLNKEFKTTIIISEFTYGRSRDLKVRDLGEVHVRGKERPVRIYELLDTEEVDIKAMV
ncbi:MAG: adenylate/guanylate cyclase domain-containing protein [Deltaproteobacteria bacterium]|uniref:Adenylate/guanylate cyclase domain-containing protein n=1 Tax=Candidatus Zymogenus saltonus TaxID=2844893 RepID=A0A9D8PNX6_9DELT|nr:adenylate/guanylate cyclase domain-containing protein [Candidatus Zymogenus saltonus]